MNRFNEIFNGELETPQDSEWVIKQKRETLKIRLCNFSDESNMIENIYGNAELNDHQRRLEDLLAEEKLTVDILQTFNTAGSLRTQSGMNVFIGNHEPKPGGMHIMYELDACLGRANQGDDPYDVHHEFEKLHPFLDGNGRTGRAVWLWQMFNQNYYNIQNNFLQEWYYQTLRRSQGEH